MYPGVTTAVILHRRVQNEERIIIEIMGLNTRSYEKKGWFPFKTYVSDKNKTKNGR